MTLLVARLIRHDARWAELYRTSIQRGPEGRPSSSVAHECILPISALRAGGSLFWAVHVLLACYRPFVVVVFALLDMSIQASYAIL